MLRFCKQEVTEANRLEAVFLAKISGRNRKKRENARMRKRMQRSKKQKIKSDTSLIREECLRGGVFFHLQFLS